MPRTRFLGVRRLLAAVGVGIGIAACAFGLYRLVHGPSGGLKAIDEESLGYVLRCGETADWEAAQIANTSRTVAVIKHVDLVGRPAGFEIAYVRAWHASRHTVGDGGQARAPLVGAQIGHTPNPNGRTWHVIVGVRTPACRPPRDNGDPGVGASLWQMKDGKAVRLTYEIGGHTRTLRVGGQSAICSVPPRHRCSDVMGMGG
jgi:hypothetical protein